MTQNNLERLNKFLPFWEYYKANKCIPPINLPTLEAIAVIYQEELHPAPVRLYCSVCVEEMITTLFNQYERDIPKIEEFKELKENDKTQDQSEPKSEKLLPHNSQKNQKRRGRKVRRRKRKTQLG